MDRGELPRSAERQMVTLGMLMQLCVSESGRRYFLSCTACSTKLPLSSSPFKFFLFLYVSFTDMNAHSSLCFYLSSWLMGEHITCSYWVFFNFYDLFLNLKNLTNKKSHKRATLLNVYKTDTKTKQDFFFLIIRKIKKYINK